jgi:DNA-binding NtrC family response regulator
MTKVLLIENSMRDAERFRSHVAREQVEVEVCANGAAAGTVIAESVGGYDAAVILWEIPGPPSGFELLSQCRRRWPEMPVVVMSGALDAALAARAFTLGARDFLEKPFDSERVRSCLQALFVASDPESPLVSRLRETLLGESPIWQATLRQVARVIPASGSRILLIGESGAGKELLAQAIHRLGPRGSAPMIAVNVGEISAALIESALFGHERGAFTNAVGRHEGYLEEAGEGTLFLDEIGDLAQDLQVKLLRVIQERSFRRVGGDRAIPFNARIIAATHRDLAAAVNAGAFRRDLFHRLAEVTIQIPPLRDRKGDVEWLLGHFLALYREGRQVRFARETVTILRSYPFLGNVRELENLVKAALINCNGEVILPRHLPLESMGTLLGAPPVAAERARKEDAGSFGSPRALLAELLRALPDNWMEMTYRDATQPYIQAFDRVYLQRKLEARRYNITQAARDAGIDAKTFRKRWKEAGLQPLGGEDEAED